MSQKTQPRLMKGVRDFLPADMIKRNFVIDKIVKTYKRYGFVPLETPAMEMWEVLSGKYGEDGEQLIYRFTDRGERDLGLRYDLTVPLSRVVAMHRQNLAIPLKRYQIQPVWRADKPGKGRYREFYQCDADIVGSKDLLAESELIILTSDILKELGFQHFKVKINSRKILRAIVETAGCDVSMEAEICRSIDKMDKIGLEGVREELLSRGIPEEARDKIMEIIKIKGKPQEVILQCHGFLKESSASKEGLEELSVLGKNLENMGLEGKFYEFDIALARGLDYYTGAIYETVVEKPRIGSIAAGGRYDNLIGNMTGENMPAVGNSIGLERVITVMEDLNMYPENLTFGVDVLICRMPGESVEYSAKLATNLRREGLATELYLGGKKKNLRAQLGYADEKKIPVVLIAGGDEIAASRITLRDMKNERQITIRQDELLEKIREIIPQNL